MIVIADGGSTKCDWVGIGADRQVSFETTTKGVNPSLLSESEIINHLSVSEELECYKEKIQKIFFYGAGCGLKKQQNFLAQALKKYFVNAVSIEVDGDMAAAVYGATEKPGVVCILGTGSNCCFFDGDSIRSRVPAMGYSLMDDASGNYIGKQLLRSYYFKQMPKHLREKFEETYEMNPAEVKDSLYKKPNPNAYLASFARFLFDHPQEEFFKAILSETAQAFVKNNLAIYKEEARQYPVHFVGSIAFFAQEYFRKALEDHGYLPGNFIQKPIEGLTDYHLRSD